MCSVICIISSGGINFVTIVGGEEITKTAESATHLQGVQKCSLQISKAESPQSLPPVPSPTTATDVDAALSTHKTTRSPTAIICQNMKCLYPHRQNSDQSDTGNKYSSHLNACNKHCDQSKTGQKHFNQLNTGNRHSKQLNPGNTL